MGVRTEDGEVARRVLLLFGSVVVCFSCSGVMSGTKGFYDGGGATSPLPWHREKMTRQSIDGFQSGANSCAKTMLPGVCRDFRRGCLSGQLTFGIRVKGR